MFGNSWTGASGSYHCTTMEDSMVHSQPLSCCCASVKQTKTETVKEKKKTIKKQQLKTKERSVHDTRILPITNKAK